MGSDLKTVWSTQELIMGGLAYTVMGILIVFLILIIIMGVIKAMALISSEKKPKAANKQNSPIETQKGENTQNSLAEVNTQEESKDDCELIAVITAAIAASMDQNTSGFVVRSYKKISGGAWNKAGRMDVLDNRL